MSDEINVKQANELRKLIVDPLAAKMDEMRQSIDHQNAQQDLRLTRHDQRLDRIEAQQGRALLGFGVAAAAVTAAINVAWMKIKEKLGWA